MERKNDPARVVWTGNGWHLARAVREIRRGRKKGQHEVRYLKGRRMKKIFVSGDSLRKIEVQNTWGG